MKSKKSWLILAGIVGLIYVCFAPLMLEAWRQKQAFDFAFRQYTAALQVEDYPRAYSMSTATFRAATSYKEFWTAHQDLRGSRGPIKAITPGETAVAGRGKPMTWIGVTHARVVCGRSTFGLVYEFHLEGGSWKLHSFRPED